MIKLNEYYIFTWKLSMIIGTIIWLIGILRRKPLINTLTIKAKERFENYR